MIPKSVSGSTLIVALGAVLTWPVWGWAGEAKETRWCFNESTNDVYPCADWPAQGIWRGPKEVIMKQWQEKQPCYQRMREAMRNMNEHYYDTPVREWEKSVEQQRWLNEQWPRVMKECVGGK